MAPHLPRAKVGRFEYLQTWERTLRGWPHVNLVLSGDQLRSWVEGDGVVRGYVGGYDDWVAQRPCAPSPIDHYSGCEDNGNAPILDGREK